MEVTRGVHKQNVAHALVRPALTAGRSAPVVITLVDLAVGVVAIIAPGLATVGGCAGGTITPVVAALG